MKGEIASDNFLQGKVAALVAITNYHEGTPLKEEWLYCNMSLTEEFTVVGKACSVSRCRKLAKHISVHAKEAEIEWNKAINP